MDSRFARVWKEFEARRDVEPFNQTLAQASADRLVQALAGAGSEEPRMANAIATELLNRLSRARYMGAFIAAAVVGVVILAADAFFSEALAGRGSGGGSVMEVDLFVIALGVGLVVLGALVGLARTWRRFGSGRSP